MYLKLAPQFIPSLLIWAELCRAFRPMKFRTAFLERALTLFLCSLAVCPTLGAQLAATPRPSATNGLSDEEWQALAAANLVMGNSDLGRPVDRKSKKNGRELSAAQAKQVADLARVFYTKNPKHPQVTEARKIEVFALVSAVQLGDKSVETGLDRLVADLRTDGSLPGELRAQCAAAHDFTVAARGAKDQSGRLVNVEKVARDLIKEFPREAPGYEALMALCRARESVKAEPLARELLVSEAPEHVKFEAGLLIQRLGLVGHSLSEIVGQDGAELLAGLPAGEPVVVYSWATWGPGSIDLGQMIQARRFVAIGICMDAQVEKATQAAHRAGLGGKLTYDKNGLDGVLASRLAFSAPGQIYLIDAKGVIADVRGGEGLEAKLKAFGFKTPAIVPTATPKGKG
ncbi:MAG: hypothetical protein JNG82_01650 [Opitutaceae bacterium]|nr:hypothetical protein [Opitutaceae bacterium]